MKSKNQTLLENCTYEQNVALLEKEIEPDGLEAPETSEKVALIAINRKKCDINTLNKSGPFGERHV